MNKIFMLLFWVGCTFVVLALQYSVILVLNDPFFPNDWPKFKIDYWIESFRPQMVFATMFLSFLFVYLLISLTAGFFNHMSWIFPTVLTSTYAIFLAIFYFTKRIHYGTEFKVGPAYVDPFKVFQIPIIFSIPISLICAFFLYHLVENSRFSKSHRH